MERLPMKKFPIKVHRTTKYRLLLKKYPRAKIQLPTILREKESIIHKYAVKLKRSKAIKFIYKKKLRIPTQTFLDLLYIFFLYIFLANPKSQIFTTFSSANRMFLAAKSP